MSKILRNIVSVFLILAIWGTSAFATYCLLTKENDVVMTVTQNQVTEAQTKLKELGYYKGALDGVQGYDTIQATKKFQFDYGLSQTGELNATTLQRLGITSKSQSNTDLYLLAKCVYAEARGEPYTGQVAVAAVVLNRVKDPNFPNTLYGVVYQPWAFTAVADGQIDLEPNSSAYAAAQDALNGWDPTYGCIYYYNPVTATSKWIFSRKTVITIGKHVFAV